MFSQRPAVGLGLFVLLAVLPGTAAGQVLGTFAWRLGPYCNLLTVTAVQQGAGIALTGYDDNCGALTRRVASGTAVFNPNGTVTVGVSIIGEGLAPNQLTAIVNPATGGGTWSDGDGSSGVLLLNAPASGTPRPVKSAGCPIDSVKVGNACLDKYEASVWEIPPGNSDVVRRIHLGIATLPELQAAGFQRGVASDDYGSGCPDTGFGCVNLYAVSIPGVTPSRFITWFQAAAAARNSGKRLPTNQEWQAGALGTPDGAPCAVASSLQPTGSPGCVSDSGAFDMVGNLVEWVADWVPKSTACSGWGGFSDDFMCLAGASTTASGAFPGPGALIRGGDFGSGVIAGAFAVHGGFSPSDPGLFGTVGFRAAR
jgi:hypothetical protein